MRKTELEGNYRLKRHYARDKTYIIRFILEYPGGALSTVSTVTNGRDE